MLGVKRLFDLLSLKLYPNFTSATNVQKLDVCTDAELRTSYKIISDCKSFGTPLKTRIIKNLLRTAQCLLLLEDRDHAKNEIR